MHQSDDPLDRAVGDALRRLDHARPPLAADAIILRARERRRLTARLVAAGVTGLMLATAALAMPGSPVAKWVRQSVLARRVPASAIVTPAAVPSPPVPAPRSEIVVVPGVEFELAFEATQSVGEVRLRFGPETEVSVRAQDGAAPYTLLPAGLLVGNRGSTASYVAHVPNALKMLRVVVGGDTVFTRRNGRIVPPLAADAQGTYVLALAARRR